ncbi:hypothetical protein N308_14530, partial [Struthio camelus australis]
ALNLQKPVNCNDQSNVFRWQANSTQYNHHGDKSSLRDTCSSNAGCCSGDTKNPNKARK